MEGGKKKKRNKRRQRRREVQRRKSYIQTLTPSGKLRNSTARIIAARLKSLPATRMLEGRSGPFGTSNRTDQPVANMAGSIPAFFFIFYYSLLCITFMRGGKKGQETGRSRQPSDGEEHKGRMHQGESGKDHNSWLIGPHGQLKPERSDEGFPSFYCSEERMPGVGR